MVVCDTWDELVMISQLLNTALKESTVILAGSRLNALCLSNRSENVNIFSENLTSLESEIRMSTNSHFSRVLTRQTIIVAVITVWQFSATTISKNFWRFVSYTWKKVQQNILKIKQIKWLHFEY